MPYILYNIGLLLFSPLVAIYLLQRYFSGKSRPGWKERWGSLPSELVEAKPACPPIWIHAVSGGEVIAAVPILRELRALLPDYRILLSVITPAGREIAEKQAQPYVDTIFYFPFDLPWVARKVVRTIRPQVFVSMESELWPNLMYELKRVGATTLMVNGRITQQSFRRIQLFGSALFKWMIGNMDALLMQSCADADRIRVLDGGRVSPDRIAVFGNSKFDQEVRRLSPDEASALQAELKLPQHAPVFVAGSTRTVEEEDQVVQAYKSLRATVPDLCLILAPRHLNRAGDVYERLCALGLNPVNRTQLAAAKAPVHQIVLDTFGELANIFALATVAFIGNSFAPVFNGGGHNLLQPLAHGKPVFFGPFTATCKAEAELAVESGVGFRVADGAALAAQALPFFTNEGLRKEIEGKALNLIADNRGVSFRYAQAIARAVR